jgi:hypothetical protein
MVEGHLVNLESNDRQAPGPGPRPRSLPLSNGPNTPSQPNNNPVPNPISNPPHESGPAPNSQLHLLPYCRGEMRTLLIVQYW